MPDDSDLKFVRRPSEAANARSAKALFIGGHAVNLHGVSRYTEDIDFLIDRAAVPNCGNCCDRLALRLSERVRRLNSFPEGETVRKGWI